MPQSHVSPKEFSIIVQSALHRTFRTHLSLHPRSRHPPVVVGEGPLPRFHAFALIAGLSKGQSRLLAIKLVLVSPQSDTRLNFSRLECNVTHGVRRLLLIDMRPSQSSAGVGKLWKWTKTFRCQSSSVGVIAVCFTGRSQEREGDIPLRGTEVGSSAFYPRADVVAIAGIENREDREPWSGS